MKSAKRVAAWTIGVGLGLLLAWGLIRAQPAPVRPLPRPAQPAAGSAQPRPETSFIGPRLAERGTRAVPVLMYHDVLAEPTLWFDLSTADFERQMAKLAAAQVQVVRLSALVAQLEDGQPLPPRALALTFDQGTVGQMTDALPILRRYGFPATFFVHTGQVGRTTSKQHMTWEQLRACQSDGLIEVQPMTVSFPEHTSALPAEKLRAEFASSKAAVERELGPVAYTAHPYGNGDERVATVLKELGYQAAWNEVRAPCAAPADRYFLPRYAPKRIDEAITVATAQSPQDTWPCVRVPLTADRTPPPPAPVGYGLSRGVWSPGIGRALRRAGQATALAEGAQLAALGRPLLVTNGETVVIARFNGWMNPQTSFETPADPLDTLLPGATDATLGQAWVLHRAKPFEVAGRATVLVGCGASGWLGTLRAERPVPLAELATVAQTLGWVEAVAF